MHGSQRYPIYDLCQISISNYLRRTFGQNSLVKSITPIVSFLEGFNVDLSEVLDIEYRKGKVSFVSASLSSVALYWVDIIVSSTTSRCSMLSFDWLSITAKKRRSRCQTEVHVKTNGLELARIFGVR